MPKNKPEPKKKPVVLKKKNVPLKKAIQKPRSSATSLPKKKPASKGMSALASLSQIKVKVFGVGGGGGNAISRMSETMNTRSIDMIAVNTDSQDLEKCTVKYRIHIGKNLTRGRGTGMNPELGRQAGEENRSEIVEAVADTDLVFITAGLGGGTGSGAAPIVARAAKEGGALTIAIVTKPFTFEGPQRLAIADEAIANLRNCVDALIIVPNDRIFNVIKKETPHLKAFQRIDDILKDAIFGITGLIASTGINNVDFADVETIMKDAGSALIGVGISTGKDRAISAATQAINSPLLEFSIDGAQGVLFGVSGGRDLKMSEINDIAKTITATTDPSAKIIFGTYHDRKLKKGVLKVTLIATGFTGELRPAITSEEESAFDLFSDNLLDSGLQTQEVEEAESKEEDVYVPGPEQPRLINESVFAKDREDSTKNKNARNREVSKGGSKTEKIAGPEPVNDNSDIWEIPAFLRRKKKK